MLRVNKIGRQGGSPGKIPGFYSFAAASTQENFAAYSNETYENGGGPDQQSPLLLNGRFTNEAQNQRGESLDGVLYTVDNFDVYMFATVVGNLDDGGTFELYIQVDGSEAIRTQFGVSSGVDFSKKVQGNLAGLGVGNYGDVYAKFKRTTSGAAGNPATSTVTHTAVIIDKR